MASAQSPQARPLSPSLPVPSPAPSSRCAASERLLGITRSHVCVSLSVCLSIYVLIIYLLIIYLSIIIYLLIIYLPIIIY